MEGASSGLNLPQSKKRYKHYIESRNLFPLHRARIIHYHIDVKMCLTRKACLVAGGHMTDPPKESTYSSVVSRDSVRIAFTLAALNDLDILAADVQNAYGT